MRRDAGALGVEDGSRAGLQCGIDGKHAHAKYPEPSSPAKTDDPVIADDSDCSVALNRPYLDHLRHKMLEQILDAVLERGG